MKKILVFLSILCSLSINAQSLTNKKDSATLTEHKSSVSRSVEKPKYTGLQISNPEIVFSDTSKVYFQIPVYFINNGYKIPQPFIVPASFSLKEKLENCLKNMGDSVVHFMNGFNNQIPSKGK